MSLIQTLKKVLRNIDENISLDEKFLTPLDTLVIKRFLESQRLPLIQNSYFDYMNSCTQSGRTYTPIHNISNRGDIEQITQEITQTIIGFIQDAQTQKELKICLNYIISELLNNIVDHSGSQGWSMAQYYPKLRKVIVCIMDCGCGFLHRINSKFSEITTELEAIKKALQRGVTASIARVYNQERNSGYGLYIIYSLAKEIKNSEFLIASNNQVFYFGPRPENCNLQTSLEGSLACFSLDIKELENNDYYVDNLISFAKTSQEDEDFDIF